MRHSIHPGRLGVILGAIAWLSAPAMAQSVTDQLGVPGPIELSGVAYELSWSSQPSADYVKQEYLPPGQSSEAYNSMVLVEFVVSDLTPIQMAAAQVEMLNQRKATDPLVNIDLLTNEQTGEALLDFIVSSKGSNGEFIVEWNGYRYASTQGGGGRNGGLLLGVSHRAYGNAAAQTFLQSLGDLKRNQIDALTAASLPELER